jgi:cell division protein FtsB
MAQARRLWARRISIAVALAIALGYVPYHLYASSGLARYLRLRAERDRLHGENLTLAQENQRLRGELEALSEPGRGELSRPAIERAARDELGLVKPGEVVFQLEPATP